MTTVFICHSSIDKTFVLRLADAIRKRDVKVWLDNEQMKVGGSLVKEISEGLANADYIIVVLSKHSVNSEWVNRELEIAINREIHERRLLVLPVLYQNVRIPVFLTGRIFADFRKKVDFKKSVQQIIGAITSSEAINKERRTNYGVSVDDAKPFIHKYISESNFNTENTFENFIAHPGNIVARSVSVSGAIAPDIATNNIFIYGGVGIGKTHLAHAICNLRQEMGKHITYLESERFTNNLINSLRYDTFDEYRDYLLSRDFLVIDDIEFFPRKGQPISLFLDVYRQYCHKGKGIVLVADRLPEDILPELKVRNQMVCRLDSPDMQGRRDILYSKLRMWKDVVPDFVIEFLAQNFSTNNIRVLQDYLKRLLELKRISGREISLDDLEKLLEGYKKVNWL